MLSRCGTTQTRKRRIADDRYTDVLFIRIVHYIKRMKTSETTRPTLSSLPVGKRAEEGTPHNLFTVIGLDDSPSPYLSPSVKALIDQGCVFSGGARPPAIVAPLLPAGAKWLDITVPLDQVFARYAGHPHI
ncbi:bifunctional cobalt-precorrin-7 (C(5))-methyltransferase/cobalt-precorrin-6B (C(15))-methyltransferase, partial [Bacteroides fragilis]